MDRLVGVDIGNEFMHWVAMEKERIVIQKHSTIREVCQEILELCPDMVILEDFVLYPNTVKSYYYQPMLTSEALGAMKYALQIQGTEFVLQKASEAKIVKDKHLKNLGLYVGNPHLRDAIRHIVVYRLKIGRR